MNDMFQKLDQFLIRLTKKGLHYRLSRFAEGEVMVEVHIPGHRWEVQFCADGTIDVEVFSSNGEIRTGEDVLEELFRLPD